MKRVCLSCKSKKTSRSNLVFVLTLGDPLSSDLDLGRNKTFHHVVAVQTKQEGYFLSLCINIHSQQSLSRRIWQRKVSYDDDDIRAKLLLTLLESATHRRHASPQVYLPKPMYRSSLS